MTLPAHLPHGGGRRRGQGENFAQHGLPARDEQPTHRIVHDIPPTWDGKDPDNGVDPFLKSLRIWLLTTKTQKTQQGAVILQYAYGELKTLINELEIDDLTAEDSGERVFKLVQNTYKEYLHKKLPKQIEIAIFEDKQNRHGGETMLQYCSRKSAVLRKLDRAMTEAAGGHLDQPGIQLPSQVKGYLLLRGAKLSDRAWDIVETWLKGDYEEEKVLDALKRLERPVPGRGGQSHLCGFVDGENVSDTYLAIQDSPGPYGGAMESPGGSALEDSFTFFMEESLFLDPESFNDEDVLDEFYRVKDDPDVLFVSGDLGEDLDFLEDEAVSILANYGQVRKYLHQKVLGRGFNRPNRPQNSSRGQGPPRNNYPRKPPNRKLMSARPKKWSKKFLISKSICARCGQKGH